MRFVTFNALHGLHPGDPGPDPDAWPFAVASLQADVLALQEVDRRQVRSGGVDMTAVAAQAADLPHWRFAPVMLGRPGRWRDAGPDDDAAAPAHGIALLSRYPVSSWTTIALPGGPRRTWVRSPDHLLPRVRRDRPRCALVARVASPAGDLTVVATHLTPLRGQNVAQLRALVDACAALPRPLVVLGDLNLGPATARSVTGWSAAATAGTFPADDPHAQVDHVLVDGPLRADGAQARATGLSDHRALVVDLTRT
ncbi:endonuclease/exonuclease/phosphatase family protein [Cellulomonas composti]|uniref:Endonuclease/exonuclease/phosphatase n=1 Tax=Cellulomonas composti TaxID=266130 RepID=A0A511J6K3_9CELL|nr:endonuclease/exonuclease/phosphatase family protein [Cellulomonas composti]GEL93636.1 endonuclease/exonuclease/phosphatase [Cellulomonas composti]